MRSAALVAAILLLVAGTAAGQEVPDGWRSRRSGDEVTVTPRDLRPGQVFSVTGLRDEAPAGRKLGVWFTARVKREGARVGTVVKEHRIEAMRGGVLKQALAVKTPAGAVVAVIYLGGPGKTGQFEMYRIISSADRAVAAAYMVDAFHIIESWPSRPREEIERTATPAPREQEVDRARPGSGVRPSEIEMFAAEMYMKPSMDFSVQPAFRPVMVLKSGDVCDRLDVPAADMDVAAHRRAHPGWWGKWRRRGRAFERLGKGGAWKKVDWKKRLRPARPGDRLRGTFSTVGGAGTEGGRVVASRSLTFLPGGRFRSDEFGSASTSGAVASSSGSKGGSYRLDGSTLELRYRDGKVERRSFLTSGPRMRSFFLGSALYAIDD